jgi:hypothetical protein
MRHVIARAGLAVAAILFVAAFATTQKAAAVQVGPADQVTLNPGGGVLANGSDGVRFTVNSDTASGNPNFAYPGADAMVYRNTYQYCCGAGAPMLNIGGTLYGVSGPASSGSNPWTSVEVVSMTGAAVEGNRTSAIGNSSVTLKYTRVVSGLTYTITRTVSYVYPNDYVTDSYTFVIPEGNAATVKFYLGGDTAPGSSDSGYGIMLTSPVRSVISLNTSSQIMFGFREVVGSKVFDGATSQQYNAPYSTVSAGGNIGYVVTASNHDAGLMVQWNLGSTPGTQTGTLQQFATKQGTNLNAVLSASSADINETVTLDMSIANTVLTTVSSLGYTFTLPAGLVLGSTTPTNNCGGTVTSAPGGSTVVVSGATVSSGTNCIVSVPVVASVAGTYVISSSSFSALVGALTNNVSASSLSVVNPDIGDDANGDGKPDSTQANLYTYTSMVTQKTVALQADESCTVSSAKSVSTGEVANQDTGFEYLNGLIDFTLACGTPGFVATVTQYYYNVPSAAMFLRKYDPNTGTYATIEDAVITQRTINGQTVTVVTYEVADGGPLDADGLVDGYISDPAGLATVPGAAAGAAGVAGVPNTGVAPRGLGLVVAIAAAGVVALALHKVRRSYS